MLRIFCTYFIYRWNGNKKSSIIFIIKIKHTSGSTDKLIDENRFDWGYKIMLEGQSDVAYRAKTRIKGMEHDERMADKKYAHERYKIEQSAKQEHSKTKMGILVAVACIIGYLVIFVGYFGSAEKKSIQQEEQLQALVEEVMMDIENEDFDTAYIKAQSIKYTADWSSEIEDKWDNIRKEVIDQIIKEEKEATGSSLHKPEKDGWFD